MIATLSQVIALLACAVILARSEPAINRMTRRTAFTIRAAMHFLTVGSAGQILMILAFGEVPSLAALIVFCGAALLLVCERRMRAFTGLLARAENRIDAEGMR